MQSLCVQTEKNSSRVLILCNWHGLGYTDFETPHADMTCCNDGDYTMNSQTTSLHNFHLCTISRLFSTMCQLGALERRVDLQGASVKISDIVEIEWCRIDLIKSNPQESRQTSGLFRASPFIRNFLVTPAPTVLSQKYCRTNGRRTAVHMGGVLQYKW